MIHYLMASVVSKIKLEPAIVVSLIAAIAAAVAAEDVTNWESLAAIVVGAIIRQFVTPTPKAKIEAQDAFFEGLSAGINNGPV